METGTGVGVNRLPAGRGVTVAVGGMGVSEGRGVRLGVGECTPVTLGVMVGLAVTVAVAVKVALGV